MRLVVAAAALGALALTAAVLLSSPGEPHAQSTPPTPTRTLGFAPNPTSTRTPPSSGPRTHTPTRTATSPGVTRTPLPTATPTRASSVPSPTTTRPPQSVPTPTRTATPVVAGIATPQPTDLPVTVLTPEPTDLPVAVPPPSSTPPQISAGGGAVPDLVATAVEVTQGMQNLANDMPLVVDRLTVARVYVKTDDPVLGYVNVNGALAAFRNGQFIGQVYPENAPINAVPSGGLRTNIDDSLYFYVPGSWTTEGELTLRAFVYAGSPNAPEHNEPDAENNVVEATVEFHTGDPLKVRLVPVHLHTGGNAANADITYHYDDHEPDGLAIILDLLRLHPLGTSSLFWDASSTLILEDVVGPIDIAVTSVKPVGHQDGFEWTLSVSDHRDQVNERIKFFKSMAPETYDGWRWYGMVDPTMSMGGFIGWANNGVSHGQMNNSTTTSTWNNIGGYALAHEIAHLFLSAPEHVACSGGESGPDPAYPYPAPNCQLADIDPEGYYGFDTYWQLWGVDGPTVISNDPGAAANQFAFPMMGAKSPWWIDPFYYCRLLDDYGITCDPLALDVSAEPGLYEQYASIDPPTSHDTYQDQSPAARSLTQSGPYAYVSASADTAAGAASILEVMLLPEVSPGNVAEALARQAEDRLSGMTPEYTLALEDATGASLVVYPMLGESSSSHEPPMADAGTLLFADIIEFPETTAAIRVRRGGNVVAERLISANAPVVQLISPNGGEQLSGNTEVRWQASDADGDALAFTLMYSADGGESWTPVATDLRGVSATLPSTAGLSGTDRALMRVIASDGMRSAADESDAAFTVPNNPPLPYIVAPADGAELPQGATALLLGAASDLEDGTLASDALRWHSSFDGDLGSGREIATRTLSRGEHTITLTATDAAGESAERSITLTVGESKYAGVPSDDEQQDIERGLGLSGDDEGDSNARWLAFAGAAAAAAAASAGGFMLARSRRRRA